MPVTLVYSDATKVGVMNGKLNVPVRGLCVNESQLLQTATPTNFNTKPSGTAISMYPLCMPGKMAITTALGNVVPNI